MSDRLTDEEIARLFLIADTHSGGITMSRANARAVLLELQERRAADPSAEQYTELLWLRGQFSALINSKRDDDVIKGWHNRAYNAISVLDRIINGGGR